MKLSKKTLSALGAVLALVVAVLMTMLTGTDDSTTDQMATPSSSVGAIASSAPAATPGSADPGDPAQPRAPGVPDYAYDTLDEIDAGRWPESADAPGTQGGRTFMNREGNLPADGSYQEWDVNPKEPGRSRDAERIVTGADGSAWYTGDHYESFTRMR